jgi:cell division protein FtsA
MVTIVTGIDIGSTKICAVIAQKYGENISITGVGSAKSNGLKKGAVTNIELAAKSIKSALNDAKRVAGTEIDGAIISISGTYTKSFNSHGIVNIPSKEITQKEIGRVIQTALYNSNIPSEYEIIHALPYNFKLDDQDSIDDPLGMSGSRLEVSIHIIAAQKSSLENILRATKMANIKVDSIVLSSYASSISVLNADEKELGAAVIDIGGATSNMAIHYGNSVKYDYFVAIGSNHITSDLSMALHTPIDIADKIKIDYGSLTTISNDNISIPVIGDETRTQSVSLEIVSNVIFARAEETLMILAKVLEKSGYKNSLGAGIVLTGGMVKLEGIRELATPIFDNIPVRIGKPREIDGMFENLKDPAYSTVIGLVLYGFGEYTLYELDFNKRLKTKTTEPEQPQPQKARVISGDNNHRQSENRVVEKRRDDDTMIDDKREEEPIVRPFDHRINENRPLEAKPNGFQKLINWATKLF